MTSQPIQQTIKNWHQLIKAADPEKLNELLADEVVFHSPVMHTPQAGKPLVKMYLTAAFHVLLPNQFQYLRQVLDDNQAVLEFQAEIDGLIINGVDMIACNDAGQITDFKVMLRPLKALNLVQQKMFELLQKQG
ncbi:nuclear transport factor 2 family protein [Marinicella litoralis]|uniref:SnoaL-like protein n=1 Tax=Marinicella litoralis TaxID=644220 RepID=A0A4V3DIJ9_9GAMM|nr:nuclear transport factor 2 family protein [Marinicella litoralis]TDR22341.1 SnoaL-like protein [Marinicella litoralis]